MFIYRNYALRRIKDAFKDNKKLTEPDAIQKQYQFASENLDVIRRQVEKCNIRLNEIR